MNILKGDWENILCLNELSNRVLTLIKPSHLRGKGDNSQSCYDRMEVKNKK